MSNAVCISFLPTKIQYKLTVISDTQTFAQAIHYLIIRITEKSKDGSVRRNAKSA